MDTIINPEDSVSLESLLSSVPVKNRSVKIVKETEEGVVLRVSMKKRWFMRSPFSWIFPFRTHRSFSLDKFGVEVWSECDGKKRTEEIVDWFAGRHCLSFHESRLAVLEFLKMLTHRGMIVIVGMQKHG